MYKKLIPVVLVLLAGLLFGTSAKADSITQGGVIYTFNVVGTDSPGVYDIQMTVDTSGADASGSLSSFAIQFAGSTNVVLDSGASNNIGAWTFNGNHANDSSGCNTNSNPPVDWCFDTGTPITFSNDGTGGTYTFEFDVTYPGGSLPSTADLQAFQGQGDLAISNAVGVPEPSSISMVGIGVLGLMGLMLVRRKITV